MLGIFREGAADRRSQIKPPGYNFLAGVLLGYGNTGCGDFKQGVKNPIISFEYVDS